MQPEKNKIEDLLFKYFTGRLNETEEKELLQWIKENPSHKKQLQEMADWWAVAHIPLFLSDVKASFHRQFSEIANDSKYVQKPVIGKKSSSWWKIAATILILLTTGISTFYVGRQTQPKETRVAYYETTVPLGAQSKVVLPDHSVVWVNAGSTMKYYEDPRKQTRNIQLEGEAYFEVSKNPEMPFIVASGSLQVAVLGTSFNVKAYENQETIDIVLISGKVDVQVNNETNESFLLSPDEMLTYNKQTSHIEKQHVTGSDYCVWKNRQLKFEKQSFIQLAKDLERIYNVRIQIESDFLKKEYFSGSFSHNYSLNDILREIDVEKKYDWTYNENQLVIRDR